MSQRAIRLPEPFRDLEAHVDWALPTETERNHKRTSSTMAEIQEYYDFMLGRAEAVLDHLDQYPLEAIPDDALPLMWMMLSLAEVATAVEIFGAPTIPDAVPFERFPPSDYSNRVI